MALRVKAVLDADGARFQQAMGRADMAVRGLVSRMATVFSVGAMASFARNTVQWASRMTDLAAQTGLTVEEIQRLDRVAIRAGVSLDRLTKAYNKIDYQRAVALANPEGRQAQAFAAFGIGPDALRTASPRDIMKQIGTQDLQRLKGELQMLFESSGPELIEAFRIYSTDALQNMATMSADTANQLDLVADQMGIVSQAIKIQLAPALAELFRVINRDIEGSKALRAANPGAKGWIATYLGWLIPGMGYVLRNMSPEAMDAMRKANEDWANLGAGGSGGSGGHTYTAPESRTAAARRGLYTDPLLSVGNFLGSGGGAVQSILQRHYVEAVKTNMLLAEVNNSLKPLLSFFGGFGL